MNERDTSRRDVLKTGVLGVATALAGCAGGQQTPTATPTFEGPVVEVGPNGDYRFDPGTSEPIRISSGTTVQWVWKSDNHNIVVGGQPAGANWKGTPRGKSEIYNEGYTYKHTFETTGKYHY